MIHYYYFEKCLPPC